jgi:16S rRNA (guanine966-N2)-methyltransferase
MLRIIAGRARGIKLEVPSGGATRPMDGRARGALFNILGAELSGARVLDLYAGSGSLGLEALSRGAAECVFVDRDRNSVRALQGNLEACGLEGEVLALPVGAALKMLAARGCRFSLAFFDPPFRDERQPDSRAGVLQELAAVAELLLPGVRLVWRLERRNFHPEELPASLDVADRREYGRSLLVFLQPRAAVVPAPQPERQP